VKTRPLQKNVYAVHALATVCKNVSSGNTICKRRTYVVASWWMCVDIVPFHLYLFDVEENLWPRCSCFRHASFAHSQTPGRLELVGFFSIVGPTQNFS
jgi:hypothetical protein